MTENIELNPLAVYKELEPKRSDYENLAESMSKLTVASLFLPEGSTSSTEAEETYSSRYSSFAIDSLASQMQLALLPASSSSFRFDPDAQ